ncbi:MAG TPA: radical SAM protein [Bacteroidales bacterium]|nr:radical SAM protein [Bacteroidales bacterium]
MFDSKKSRLKKKYNLLREKRNHNYFCNAPFTALRFHRNGGVQICCHHIDYQFLENKTLHEIWFGKELESMRKQMRNFDIPKSCNFCSSAFYSENFSNVNALSFDFLEQAQNGYPALMDFSLENTCNLSCIMCDASLSSSIQKEKNIYPLDKNFHYDDGFISQLEEFLPNLKVAVFTGGEPFLIKSYFPIWKKMIEINPKITINVTTNGTVYNSVIEDILLRGRFNITVSVDSFEAANYNCIRKGADFNKTMANVYKFAEYCKNRGSIFTITACPMQMNSSDIPGIVSKCNSEDWDISFNTVIKPWNQALWSLKSEELEDVINYYKNYNFESTTSQLASGNIKKFSSLIDLLQIWLDKTKNFEVNIKSEISINDLRKEIFNIFIAKLSETEVKNNRLLVQEKVKLVVLKIPDMLISEALLNYADKMSKEMIKNEFEQNDIDTIIDHMCIIAFNI